MTINKVGQVAIGGAPDGDNTLTVHGDVSIDGRFEADEVVTDYLTGKTGPITVKPGLLKMTALNGYDGIYIQETSPGMFVLYVTTPLHEELVRGMLATQFFYVDDALSNDGTTTYNNFRFDITYIREDVYVDPIFFRKFTLGFTPQLWLANGTTLKFNLKTQADGQGLEVTTIFDYIPPLIDTQSLIPSIKMYNKSGIMSSSNSYNTDVATQPRWEVQGGHLMLRNYSNIRYMFAITESGGLALHKITADADGKETSQLVNLFDISI